MNQVLLADVIAWVGVACGVVGAIVVAPSGFVKVIRQLRAVAGRLLFRKRKPVSVIDADVSMSSLEGRVYPHKTLREDLPTEEVVRQLVTAVNSLNTQVAHLQQYWDNRHDELRQAIGLVEAKLGRTDAQIRGLMAAAAEENASFNARGLPLIALGIVMTGPTGILAEWAAVGCIFVAAGVCAVIYGVWPWLTRQATSE